MHPKGRTGKSIRNIFYALSNQILMLAIGLISRVVFLRVLNEAYLGINSLFAEVISMLSMADLGLASVMLFSFFEPLAKQEKEKLTSLVKFYKKIYHIIALVVALIGCLLVPFLQFIINLDNPIEHIYSYYYLFLVKTVVSYLFVYKSVILLADQRNYLISRISIYCRSICVIFQILLLILTKNYFIYLSIDVLFTFVNNFLCARQAVKLHPYINESTEHRLDEKDKKGIFKSIKDGFLYKISGVVLNSTDNTIISVLIGTIAVGQFANYSMVTTKIANLISVVFNNLTGSLGNLIVTESKERRTQVFLAMQNCSNFISSIVITCVFVLINDLIGVWLGKEYILGDDVTIALLMNLYFSVALQPMWTFRDATALFRRTKFTMLACAFVNIVLSVILGNMIGLAGIIVASALARMCTYFWYEPLILFREYFNVKVSRYFRMHGGNVAGIFLISFIVHNIYSAMPVLSWTGLINKSVLVVSTTFVFYFLVSICRKDFRDMLIFFKERLKGTKERY